MKFSITIPAYKQKYLYEAIDSCLAQTYKEFELIIVDDASPEDLKSVVAKFQDGRIKYYRNEKNCGALNVVDNWNICLSYAVGDYVICMGDDDRLLPTCLEEYSKLIDKYPNLNIYHALTEIIDDKGNVCKIQEPRPEYEGMYSMIYGRLNNHRLQFIGDWLFKRDWLIANKGYVKMPLAWGSDDLTAYYAAKEKGVANSQQPLFQYRVNPLTITNGGNSRLKYRIYQKLYFIIRNDLLKLQNANIDVKEKVYKKSIEVIVDKAERKLLDCMVFDDIRKNGKINSLIWWLYHSSTLNISKTKVLKIWATTLNK